MDAGRFRPVACMACGQLFQVAQDRLGQEVTCPWCQAVTPALPVAAPSPNPTAAPAAPTQGTPSSAPSIATTSDTQEQSVAASPSTPVSAARQAPAVAVPSAQPSSRLPGSPRDIAGAVVGVFVLAIATLAVLRYHRGYVLAAEWQSFTAPDGSVQIELLGSPREEAEADGSVRFWSRGWYSGVYAFVGWQLLTPEQAESARLPDARKNLDRLIQAELDRWRSRFGGNGRTATLQFTDPLIVEIHWEAESLHGVGRVVVVPLGKQPRVYVLGLVGPRITPSSPAARRFFDSFHYVTDF